MAAFNIFQDWRVNKRNPKGRFLLLLYRTAMVIRHNKVLLLFFFWYLPFYILIVEWIMGAELTLGARLGKNTQIWHAHALVLNPKVVIGDNCLLRHSTTIGNSGKSDKVPVIGNNVNIGSNVCIIGSVTIGDNVSIGAGTIVVKDIPSDCVVVGNPAKIVKK